MSEPSIIEQYLQLMDQQREACFRILDGLTEPQLWESSPREGEWCIGEILDHTRAVNVSFLPMIRGAWFVGRALAAFQRSKPYPTTIDDVYHRPNFPMNVGWLWPPRYSLKKPASLSTLQTSLEKVHAAYRDFYTGKDEALLGHIHLFDPAIGRLNLIQTLRVGLYHDQLHFEDVIRYTHEIKSNTTPVA
jgi:hypothetical protein